VAVILWVCLPAIMRAEAQGRRMVVRHDLCLLEGVLVKAFGCVLGDGHGLPGMEYP
jgi:hypothetical protein